MHYTNRCQSPLGNILLAADETGLTGLWFEGQRHFASHLQGVNREMDLPVFTQTKEWLDIYFSGKQPDFDIPLHFVGTPFQNRVWEILCSIPYGQTTTYGEIAKLAAQKSGLSRMSPQAAGGAVSRNKISIIVPCHRVVGAGGSLTGYAGGLDKKISLLKLEGALKESFFIPKHKAAP